MIKTKNKHTKLKQGTVWVDQSGRVEYTSHDTVIAFSDSKQKAIKVSAKTKRQIQEIFRRRGAIHLFIYRTFAALVFLLIKEDLNQITHVIIDTEYPGHEALIKDIILEFLRKYKLKEPDISFQRIGNKPKVHYAAYDVFRKKKKESQTIKTKVLTKLVIKRQKMTEVLKD